MWKDQFLCLTKSIIEKMDLSDDEFLRRLKIKLAAMKDNEVDIVS